jgi:hypothetical protein
VGLAGLTLGSVTGIIVLQKKAVVEERCDGTICDAEGKVAADSAFVPGVLSTVGFSLGAAGITAGILLWIMDTRSPDTNASGGRVRALVGAAPTGAIAGVTGEW